MRTAKFKIFQSDHFNRILVVNEFWTRSLDAFSTRRRLINPCGCYREASRFFGLNMTPVFETDAGPYSYSLGVTTAYSLLSARLWNSTKDHPRHARILRWLSRSLLIGDSFIEAGMAIHNLRLDLPRPGGR